MSVHDVAAVDHLNSLKVSRASKLPRKSPQHPLPSLPTSPTRDQRPNSDTLRQAMARHQVRWRSLTTTAILCQVCTSGQLVKTRVPPPQLQ